MALAANTLCEKEGDFPDTLKLKGELDCSGLQGQVGRSRGVGRFRLEVGSTVWTFAGVEVRSIFSSLGVRV